MTQTLITPTDTGLPDGLAEKVATTVEIARAEANAQAAINGSGYRATEYNVLVRMDPVAKQTAGGVILPDEHADRLSQREIEVTVADVPPMAFDHWADGIDKPVCGQRCIITRHAGLEIKGSDGETYRIISDKDVRALKEGA